MSGADAGNWRALNRANWDERVAVHLKSPGYDLNPLRAGRGVLNPVDEAEIGEVEGLRVLHLQCHFGADTLCLAQRGATVVGLDFSGAAIDAARTLAGELGLSDRARFVQADLYDAPAALAEPAAFDLVYTSWGVTCWLPDIRRWAEIVAHFLKPGGRFYYADAHPAAYVFDDRAGLADGRPGYFAPYFERQPIVMANHKDYADPAARSDRCASFMLFWTASVSLAHGRAGGSRSRRYDAPLEWRAPSDDAIPSDR